MNFKDILTAPFDLATFLAKNTWDEFFVKGISLVVEHLKNPETAKDALDYLKMSFLSAPTDPRVKDILTAALLILQKRNANLHKRMSERLAAIETGPGGSEEKLSQLIVRIIPVPDDLGDKEQRKQAAQETADILTGYGEQDDEGWQTQLVILEEEIKRQKSAWEKFKAEAPEVANMLWSGVKTVAGDTYDGGKKVLKDLDEQAGVLNQHLQDNRPAIEDAIKSWGAKARAHRNRH